MKSSLEELRVMAGEIISKLEARSMKYMNIESQNREKNN